MDFREVHDLHLAVVADKTAFLALAREADAPGDVLVEITEHDQWLYQEYRFAALVLHQAQVVANPACRAVVRFAAGAVFVVEFVEVEGPGVVYKFCNIQGDVRATTAQADQAHRRKLLVQAQLGVVFDMHAGREHQVAQAVEVVEDALDIGLGEVQVLLRVKRPRAVETRAGSAVRGSG
ncbi:hypothetical protein D3C85_1121750 [compost metagenome]